MQPAKGARYFRPGSAVASATTTRGVGDGAAIAQGLDDIHRGGAFLPYQYVDAIHVLVALIDDRIHRQGALAHAVVANEQLPLALADGDHGIHDLVAAVQRIMDEVAMHDGRRQDVQRQQLTALGGGQAV